MRVEVDLSGRIEETNHPTSLALSNGIAASIRITAGEKRRVLSALKESRPKWSRKFIRVQVFSVLLYLLLKDHIEQVSMVVIDPEYPGHEPVIKDRVLTLCRKQGLSVSKDLVAFHRVTKKSPAHDLASKVYRKKVEAGRKIDAEEVLAEFSKRK